MGKGATTTYKLGHSSERLAKAIEDARPPERCETCRHERDGRCCRHAPQPALIGAIGMMTTLGSRKAVWPSVEPDDGCGDWREKGLMP